MTNAQLVDNIIVQIRANNVDGVPPRRFILNTARDIATTLISQKLLERTLTRDTYLYTTIDCVEFEKSERVKCPILDLRRCNILMKSKKPLPKPIFSRLGSSIKNIRSVDGGFEFTLGYEQQIRRNNNRKYKYDKDIFVYLGTDGYLYIPDNEIYLLSLDLITLETDECDCEENCKSAWDYEFKVPDRFLQNVIDYTIQKLVLYKQIPTDENPNNVEGT